VLFSIKLVPPIRAFVVIGHVITFAVDTLESVRTQFTLFGFKTKGFNLKLALQY